jgi:transposase
MAIRWIAYDRRNANEIAARFQISTRTVHRWIRLFNTGGPAALEIVNLGGRQWAYLSEAEERAALTGLQIPIPIWYGPVLDSTGSRWQSMRTNRQ